MAVGFGFSCGDLLALGKLIYNVTEALNKSRGSSADYRDLIFALSSLNQSIQACSAVFVSRSFEPDKRKHQAGVDATLNGLAHEVVCCNRLLRDFLLSSKKYAQSLLNSPPKKKFKDEWRKVIWFLYKSEDVKKLEKDLQSHIQAFQLYTLALLGRSTNRIEDAVAKGSAGSAIIEGSIAEMFGVLKTMAEQIPNCLGYAWEGSMSASEKPLFFRDALGRDMNIPLIFCSTLETFHDILVVIFKNVPGLDHVSRKQYQLCDKAEDTLMDSSIWRKKVKPGTTITMSVLMQLASGRNSNTQSCPKCGVNYPYTSTQRMVQCYYCHVYFEVVERDRVVEIVEPTRPRIRSNSDDRVWKAGQAPKAQRRTSSDEKVPKKPGRQDDPFKRVCYIHENIKLKQRRPSAQRNPSDSSEQSKQLGFDIDALFDSAEFGDYDKIQSWLREDGDVNVEDADGKSLIQAAARSGETSLVQLLLTHDVDINAQGGHWGNALQAAAGMASASSAPVVKLLLENGADPHAEGGYYGTALQAAGAFCGQQGHGEVVELLLEYGADVNVLGGAYGSTLQVLAYKGEPDIIELLLEHGAEIDALCGPWGNALQAGAATSYVRDDEAVEVLLANRAYVNSIGGQFGSALHAAVFKGKERIVGLLLDHGGDIDLGKEDGKTVLHCAVERGNVAMVEYLLGRGANKAAEDSLGRTAEDLAVQIGHSHIVKVLRS